MPDNKMKCRKTDCFPSRSFFLLVAVIFFSVMLTVGLRFLYAVTGASIWHSGFLFFMTVSYHFLMRVTVGELVTICCRSQQFDYGSCWLRQHRGEAELYRLVRVRSWKDRAITARPEQFDLSQLSADELLHNITQAELVHEIIMPLSFVPLLLIRSCGAPAVFIVTSLLACLIDFQFVIIQRYNRPRVLALRYQLQRRQRRMDEKRQAKEE